MNEKNDPDDMPTRFGGPPESGAEDRTVPSLGQGGQAKPTPPPKPAGKQDPMIGKQLGGCRIEALLGRGAMGAVYRAHQVRLDRRVAVKVIRPEMMTDPRTLKRFEVEARTVGRFNSAHVVMVHDVGFEQGVHFLVMEFIEGKNLRDHVKLLAGGRLPAAEAIPLMRQACKGLEEAQRLAVIHRDIKPDNLMLTDRGVLKIADFGIAKPVQDDFSLTMSSELIGTPLYMSPEQCQGINDLDFRSDMYSLGATFYYLLTGEPPVRASSVYELIQTKTKLENLCLWKALPELDENHPLSRVIERMTALDRDDRYPSYEALLNDIVLVEQGGTVERLQRQTKAKGALPKLQPPKQSKAGVWAGVAVLALAAAGGGYWWSTRPADPERTVRGGGDGSGDPAVLDAAAVKARLTTLRGRLATEGPSEGLKKDVAAVPAEPTSKTEREQLLADVAQGLAVQQRLGQLKAPKVELPFTALAAHLAAVGKAAQLDDTAGKELRTWAASAREAASNTRVLGLEAKSALLTAWSGWQGERTRAAGEKALVQLGERLDGIEAARSTLVKALPTIADEIDAALPVKAIAAARVDLDSKTVSPVDVDIRAALAEIAVDLETKGPAEALAERTRKLSSHQADQNQERDRLINAIQRGMERKNLADQAKANDYPRSPVLPFDDIEAYYGKLDHVLGELKVDGKLPTWAAAHRTQLRSEAELQDKALAACRTAFETWQRDSEAPNASVQALETSLGRLTRGIAKAGALFPAAKDAFDQVVPGDALATARARLEQAQAKKDLLTGLPSLRDELSRIGTIADWRSARDPLQAQLQELQQQAQAFQGDAEIQRELRNATQVRDRWAQASERFDQFATRFGAGDLEGAAAVSGAGVAGKEGRDELRALGDVVGRTADAFRVLDGELDVGRALALLEEADRKLGDVGGLEAASQRIATWRQRFADLQRAAGQMVAIPAGNTKSGPVGAFFLARTEVSQAEHARFLDELDALVGKLAGDERQAQLATRLGDLVVPPAELDRMLRRRGRLLAPDLPVDRCSWFEAASYARWYGMSLPTRDEWTLAAFGDNHQYEWPWGSEWKLDDACRNIGRNPVAVTSGGRSWRSANGKSVHHLAGNVAEWLQAEAGAAVGQLAGGRCQDPPPDARRRAAGEEFHEASLTKDLDGFGFRVALRPRAFLGSDFPSGRLPTAR